MGGCDLRIAFANGKREYLVGEFVEGDVVVEADGDCKCDGLTVEFGWRTAGKCEQEKRRAGSPVNAFQGPWSAGKSYRYPFRFEIPDAAPTYAGRNGSVEWSVTAAADVPWARDPKTEERVVVRRTPTPRQEKPPLPAEMVEREAKKWTPLTRGFIGIVCTVLIGACLAGGFYMVRYGLAAFRLVELEMPPPGVAGGVAAILGGIVAALLPFVSWAHLRRASAFRKRLGGIKMTAAPGTARAGETIRVGLQVFARERVDLQEVVGFLRVRETAIRLVTETSKSHPGSQTQRPVPQYHEDERARFGMSGPVTFVPGGTRALEATVRIPDDAVPSFRLSYLGVDWYVEIRATASSSLGWSGRVPIKIVE